MPLQMRLFHCRLFSVCQLKTRRCTTRAENVSQGTKCVDGQLESLREMARHLDGFKSGLAQSVSCNTWLRTLQSKENCQVSHKHGSNQQFSFEETLNRLVELNRTLSSQALSCFPFENTNYVTCELQKDKISMQLGDDLVCAWCDHMNHNEVLTLWTPPYVKRYTYMADDIFLREAPPSALLPKAAVDGKWLDEVFGVRNDRETNPAELRCSRKLDNETLQESSNYNRKHESGVDGVAVMLDIPSTDSYSAFVPEDDPRTMRTCLSQSIGGDAVLYCSELKTQPNSSPQPDRPSRDQLIRIQEHIVENIPKVFVSKKDYTVYRPDVIFVNNLPKVPYTKSGVAAYAMDLLKIRLYVHLKYANVRINAIKATTHEDEGAVRVHWRLSGIPTLQVLQFWKFLPWLYKRKLSQGAVWFDGISTFYVDGNGAIFKHQVDKVLPDVGQELVKENSLLKTLQKALTPKAALGAS